MFYNSTRNSSIRVTASQAIAQGISTEGGLFVPETIPALSMEELGALQNKDYRFRAKAVLRKFLTDFTEEELDYCVDNAYNDKRFDSDDISELAKVGDTAFLLELWHGPTCAFKDMALQLLPYLMTTSAGKTVSDKEIVVLVATSGDTGKAALEGFKDVPGTKMLVFYPEDGVSRMQKLQMTTQEGKNLSVCAIKGNFDDAQNGVKAIFTDPVIAEELENNGQMFSSANSINWGRLVPQIIYYIDAYLTMVDQGEIALGDKVNVAVPTGNFGNILAAYYAKQMGLPVEKLICASNSNRVLTDFIATGTYNRNREFYLTSSPSMDILISSNLERLLYELSGKDDKIINNWFGALKDDGVYSVTPEVLELLKKDFVGGYCTDDETAQTIRDTFNTYGYLCDTHTAVGVKVYEDYKKATGDMTKTIIASTASPYKFSESVLKALSEGEIPEDEFAQVEMLFDISKMPVPESLLSIREKEIRFKDSVAREEMVDKVKEMLK